VAWFDAADESEMFLSVVTVGELRRGVAMLPDGARRASLQSTQQEILRRFANRIVEIDVPIATAWGDLTAAHRRRGLNPSVSDELIAATALVRGLTVVTRNVADFESAGCKIVSPWSS
jgi:predicted nucleic acid-binding protein